MKSGEDVVPVKDGDVYRFDLSSKSDDNKFMGLNIEVSEDCEMKAEGNAVKLSEGMNYKTVADLNNDDDPGEPGVSIAKLKSLKEENGINDINIDINSKRYKLEFLF